MTKYCFQGVCAVLVLGILSFASAKTRWRTFAPQKFDRKTALQISGKKRIYYTLRKDSEIQLSLTGPTKLRVLSRAEVSSSKESSRYTYLVRRDDGKWVEFTRRSKVSAQAQLARNSSTKISVAQKHVLNVPEGSHTYAFRLPDKGSKSLFLRFQQIESDFGVPTDVVAITPNSWQESVDLVIREGVTTYYRLHEGTDLALRLIGPAKLKVLARFEFHPDMQGQQDFRVQVLEDGSVKATYPLTATRSDICQYLETSAFVPAKAETFYVEIPRGEHEYRFVLPESQYSVLLRFLLPKKDLSNGK
jgi:hypothetical protein